MKKILFVFVAMALSLTASAQLLWKISGNGLEKPSYVVGSHHIASASMIDDIKGLKPAIGEVDAVYGEVQKDALTSPEAQQKMMGYALAPADSTILTLMTKEQLDSLDDMLQRYSGMPNMSSQMAPLKPAMIDTQLSMLITMKAFPGFDPSKQFDVTVMALGEEKGKEVSGFEGLDFQMNILFGDPISRQLEKLLETLRTEDKAVDFAHRLADAYQAQDLNKLYQLITDPDLGMNEADMDRMVYDRNANWAEQLKTILPAKSVLVVVGSGHLPGDKGLLRLLGNQGYTVEPVTE